MTRFSLPPAALAPVLAMGLLVAPSLAQFADIGATAKDAAAKEITLDYPDAPSPNVEVSLSFGLFSDLFGITDSALQGVIDAALRFGKEKPETKGAEAVELTAEQLAVAQKLLALVKGSVKSLEVRVFEDLSETSSGADDMLDYYGKKLQAANWNRVLQVQDGDDFVQVWIQRNAGAIQGAYLVAAEGEDDLVIALLDCDLSPTRAKQLTDSITTAALDLGLAERLQKGLAEMKQEFEREIKEKR